MNKKHKFLTFLFLLILAGASGSAIYFLYQNDWKLKKNKASDSDKRFEFTSQENVFPDLDAEYFQKYIKLNSQNKEEIKQEIVLPIVSDVLSRLKSAEGKVEFDYTVKNTKNIEIYFKYKNGSNYQTKAYLVYLD